MDDRALGRVFDGAAQDFVGQGGGVALAQEDKPHHVDDRVDIGPVKVDMGDASGGLLQVNEQSGDGIGNGGAPGMEDAVGAFADPVDMEMIR